MEMGHGNSPHLNRDAARVETARGAPQTLLHLSVQQHAMFTAVCGAHNADTLKTLGTYPLPEFFQVLAKHKEERKKERKNE